jgi:hypothetical protein
MRRILCLVAGLIAAAIFSQAPEFQQQYGQRLGGAIDTLQQQARDFDAAATAQSLTRDQAIGRLVQNADPVAAEDGHQRQAAFERLNRLTRDRTELADPDPVTRLGNFLSHLDQPTAEATLDEFTPALPVSPAGGLFAVTGFILGYAFLALLAGAATVVARPARHGYRRKPARLLH